MAEINYNLKTVEDLDQQGISGELYSCCKCGHSWRGRPWRYKARRARPFKCPGCGSRYWWQERPRPREARPYMDPRITDQDLLKLQEALRRL